MSKSFLLIALTAAAAACSSEQAGKARSNPHSDEGTCLSYGLAPGTTAWLLAWLEAKERP